MSAAEESIKMRELTDDEIDGLLAPNTDPIIWYDKEMRCTYESFERVCFAPTYLMLNGVPTCPIHALNLCNEIIIELQRSSSHEPNGGNGPRLSL